MRDSRRATKEQQREAGDDAAASGRSPGSPIAPNARSASDELGGMVAVTGRPAVRARIAAASESLGVPSPLFVDSMAEVLELGIERPMLLLDLGHCCGEPDLVRLVHAFAVLYPATQLVLYTPLLDREEELRKTVAVVREIRSAEVLLLTGSDFARDEVWRNLWSMGERAALQAEMRTDLHTALQASGRPVPAAALVFHHLALAARHVPRQAADPSDDVLRAESERQRKLVWQQLRRSGQLPSSWLIVLFRILWHAKLRQRGWSAARIAGFLGFESPRRFRVAVARRVGVGLKELRRVPYAQALSWVANLLTTPHHSLDEHSVRAIMRPLLDRSTHATSSSGDGFTMPGSRDLGDATSHPSR